MHYVLWFLLSLLAGWLGRNRQFGFWGFFISSLFFTPIPIIGIWALTSPVKRHDDALASQPS